MSLNEKVNLEEIQFGFDDITYVQSGAGLIKKTYNYESSDDEDIGKIYIYQITVIRDIQDRFEPLYALKYEDLVFDETKITKKRTFDDLVNFIDKQKLIIDDKKSLEYILSYSINYFSHDVIFNDIPFVVKKVVDFEDVELPMHPM
ncbi:hypothetical protein [Methanobrevibacter sp.]|uniref:hypothetical protein n=1 Tax=Methanobrevibacter sp. TaxID=66852 RepID=UPI00386CEC9A